MVLGGLLSVIGSRAIGFTSAGALGCMVLSCVCGRNWHRPNHIKNVINNHAHISICFSIEHVESTLYIVHIDQHTFHVKRISRPKYTLKLPKLILIIGFTIFTERRTRQIELAVEIREANFIRFDWKRSAVF